MEQEGDNAVYIEEDQEEDQVVCMEDIEPVVYMEVLITSNLSQFEVTKRYPASLLVSELKEKMVLVTGASLEHMELSTMNNNNEVLSNMVDDHYLGEYCADAISVDSKDNKKIHVHVMDTIIRPELYNEETDVKFELSDEAYALRSKEMAGFKEQMKMQIEELKQKDLDDALRSIPVGTRVVVRASGKPSRAGTVMYVGYLKIKGGIFVGVKLDQPLGKNNGTLGEEKYFECEANYGCFVPLKDVEIEVPKTDNDDEKGDDEEHYVFM